MSHAIFCDYPGCAACVRGTPYVQGKEAPGWVGLRIGGVASVDVASAAGQALVAFERHLCKAHTFAIGLGRADAPRPE